MRPALVCCGGGANSSQWRSPPQQRPPACLRCSHLSIDSWSLRWITDFDVGASVGTACGDWHSRGGRATASAVPAAARTALQIRWCARTAAAAACVGTRTPALASACAMAAACSWAGMTGNCQSCRRRASGLANGGGCPSSSQLRSSRRHTSRRRRCRCRRWWSSSRSSRRSSSLASGSHRGCWSGSSGALGLVATCAA